ncbi:hypothetical protein C8R48DRAFT_675393 [Suillus tomentosus]|nr:hypothetical protein C8R48DRAFT_675393 [Suillus tomentosus]
MTPHQKSCCPALPFSIYGPNIDLGALLVRGRHSTILPHQQSRCPALSFSTYGPNIVLGALLVRGRVAFYHPPAPKISLPGPPVLDLWPERQGFYNPPAPKISPPAPLVLDLWPEHRSESLSLVRVVLAQALSLYSATFCNPPAPKISLPAPLVLDLWPEHRSGHPLVTRRESILLSSRTKNLVAR